MKYKEIGYLRNLISIVINIDIMVSNKLYFK